MDEPPTQVTQELEGQPQLAVKGECETIAPDMTRCVPKKCLASQMICLHRWNEPVPSVTSTLSHSPWNERLSMEKEGSGLTGAEPVMVSRRTMSVRMSHSTKARAVGSMSPLLEHTSPTLEWNRWQRWRGRRPAQALP